MNVMRKKSVAVSGAKCSSCRAIQQKVQRCPICNKSICTKCVTKDDKQYTGWCNQCIWFDIG